MSPTHAQWGEIEGNPLSEREHQTLAAFARSGRHKDAASELGITAHTVASYLSRAYTKLGVEGHIEAFLALGWLTPPFRGLRVS